MRREIGGNARACCASSGTRPRRAADAYPRVVWGGAHKSGHPGEEKHETRDLLDLIVCPGLRRRTSRGGRSSLGIGEIESRRARVWRRDGTAFRSWGSSRASSADDYADAFALEWTEFRTAHLDSLTGLDSLDKSSGRSSTSRSSASKASSCSTPARAWTVQRGRPESRGAVVAVDLSRAIDAACANLDERENIHFVQADIFKLPFRPDTFDFVYSWGVLHHTPTRPPPSQVFPRSSSPAAS